MSHDRSAMDAQIDVAGSRRCIRGPSRFQFRRARFTVPVSFLDPGVRPDRAVLDNSRQLGVGC
jgi:hypothetical protein